MSEREHLEQAIAHLEGQRVTLGHAAVDAALAALRQKLAAMEDVDGSSEQVASDMAGERKLVTIMFVDISGFTALAETMDPEAVRNLVNACFERPVPVIEKYGGIVTKFIGDSIEAVFGAPVAHENDPERALRCALEIMETLSEFNAKRGTDLGLHLGINTGLVVAGGIGTSERHDYAVTGDAINLAARLQDASERGEILVGPDTYRLTSSSFVFETLPPIKVQGKREPVHVYRLVGLKGEPERGRWLESQGIGSPLVGREADLGTVNECIARLLQGQGGFLWLIGEAGLGKSRLMAEVRKQVLADLADPSLTSQRLRWLEGRAQAFGETMSYWPFQGILWEWAGITEEDSEGEAWDKLERAVWALFAEDTAEVLPYLASLLSLEVKAPYAERVKYLDGEAMGRQVYLTARRFFERLARKRPLALVFEYLHWVDRSSAELLEHLLPLIERVPLLICGVIRPGRDTPAAHLWEVAARDYAVCYTEVRLSPLSQTESGQLIDNLLAIEDLRPRVREMIAGKAEGNPFFVEEIVRALIDAGAVVRDPVSGNWRATVQVETIAIPDTVQGVIMARVDRLDENVKEVLRTAAVIGRSFFYRVLRAIAEPDRELDGHLAVLQAIELIREKQATPELEYIFKHALAQEATYESILLERRGELHAQMGQAIETLFAGRLEEFYGLLAYHYARAEAWEKAQEYLLKAADQAGRVAADAEALAHYRQAMVAYERAFGDRWDPLQRAVLERKMGQAFFRRGEHLQANEYFQRALAFLGHPLPQTRWGIRRMIVSQGVRQVGHRLLPWLFVRPPGGPVSPAVEEEVEILRTMFWMYIWADGERCLLTTLRMVNSSERAGYLRGLVKGYTRVGRVFEFFFPIVPLARSYQRRTVALTEGSRDPDLLANRHGAFGHHYGAWGRWASASEHAQLSAEASWKAGNLRGWGGDVWLLARAHAYRGEFTRAFAASERIMQVGQDAGDRQLLCWGMAEQGRVQRWRGRWEEAHAVLAKGAEVASAVPDHWTHAQICGQLGQLHLAQGELEHAFTALRAGQCLRREHNVSYVHATPVCNGWAEAHLLATERSSEAESPDWLKKTRSACRTALKHGNIYRGGLPEAMRLQGTYEWLRGKSAAAQKWWQRSINLAEELGQPYDLGMTHLEMGRRLGERAHLERAEAIFAEIGEEWDLAQARKALM